MWLFSQIYKETVQTFSKFISLAVFIFIVSGCSDVHIRQLDSDIQNKLQMITVPSSTLKKMTMEASFTLYDAGSDENLFSDSVIGDATLGTVSSLFGQDKAETHSKERLAILLAQRVVRRLQLYFLEQAQK